MESKLGSKGNLLLCIDSHGKEDDWREYGYLVANFDGHVSDITERGFDPSNLGVLNRGGILYACGNVRVLSDQAESLRRHVKVIKEFAYNLDAKSDLVRVSLGQVPIKLHGAAVYFRDCLKPASGANYFDVLQNKHKLQALTESNKSGTSFRKGAYLSEVHTSQEGTRFQLLRCSTNLSGPTLAFADEDREILRAVNALARLHIDQAATLNHVLAQVYENSVSVNEANKPKEHKAKIKSHSDKTKDMPLNGLIAFCTFYSEDVSSYRVAEDDRFDRKFKGASVLTQLRFRLKDSAKHLSLSKEFEITLYPNSVLLIPLSTNRLYTHEIVPPTLPVGKFPTRLGYVVRCSKTSGIHKDGATFIERQGKEAVRLTRPTEDEFHKLKKLYQEENVSAQEIHYPEVYFSMNEGDFKQPQRE